MINRANAVSRAWPFARSLRLLIPLSLASLLYACGEQAQETPVQDPAKSPATTPSDVAPAGRVSTGILQRGVYFPPNLEGYALHNEYDDDGDGDGVNETHVTRYLNSAGDSAFSMTTGGSLWAWSLDTKGDDDSDIRKNFVVRDSNCDKVFDERYSLDAEFRVPDCLAQAGAAEKAGGI